MKIKLWFLLVLFGLCSKVQAQVRCGHDAIIKHLETLYPGTQKAYEQERQTALSNAVQYNRSNITTAKTSANIVIPIVFHIVLDSTKFKSIGSISGIEHRINTQIAALNEDYSGNNPWKAKIPAVWQPLNTSASVQFCLAHKDANGDYSPGYDIKIVPSGTTFRGEDGGKNAKFKATGGLDAWDNTKYLNVWVSNYRLDDGQTLLGFCVPPAFPKFTKPELGVALNYTVFGARTSSSQVFQKNFDLGRTLTHEIGHYFYLFHTWGDDSGACPDSGGTDDGFSDTPPQADASTGKPSFPRFDACTATGNGIMFMNFMDYSDDSSLLLFTTQQAAMIQSELSLAGHSYSLSLNPQLCDTTILLPSDIKLFPNPTTGRMSLLYDNAQHHLNSIVVYNMLGQKLIETTDSTIVTIDLSPFSKGVYFVYCTFDNAIIKQKIILQ